MVPASGGEGVIIVSTQLQCALAVQHSPLTCTAADDYQNAGTECPPGQGRRGSWTGPSHAAEAMPQPSESHEKAESSFAEDFNTDD